MKLKRSQISLFILISLVILIATSLILYLRGLEEFEISEFVEVPTEIAPVRSYIDECVKKSATEAAYIIGVQGGYNTLPEKFLELIFSKAPFYYFEGSKSMPSKKDIENEFAISTNERLEVCIDLSTLESQGYKVSLGNIDTKIRIGENSVIVRVDLPLTIEFGDTIHEISDFIYEVPVRLGHIYDISEQLVDKIVEEPYYIDLTFLLEQDLDVSVIHFDECNDVYVILDNYSKTLDNYLFLFAAKIDEEYCKFDFGEDIEIPDTVPEEIIENNAPVLDLINYSIAYVDEKFEYGVNAFDKDDDPIFFLDDSDLFNVHPLLGTITFVPKAGQEGLHKINITAVDVNGGLDSEWFYLEIK